MKELTKVSIIVPVYNVEKEIEVCIKSVLNQTHSNFELILVDDGSNDHSKDICEKFACIDKRISVIQQNNMGVAQARNTGILAASGEYVLFLDSDDWWNKEFLEIMVKALQTADMTICKLRQFFSEARIIEVPLFCYDENKWCWPILQNDSISCCRAIFKRSILSDEKLFFTVGRKKGEDQEFMYKYMMNVNTISYSPGAEYFYRKNSSSAMYKQDYTHFDAVEAMLTVEKYAQENFLREKSELIKTALRSYKYPYLLEFAILTVLTAGSSPKQVLKYLKYHGYDRLLTDSLTFEKHYISNFMKLWRISPQICLIIFYLRKSIGNYLRKINILK